MAVTYQSVQSAAIADATLVITKPTDLAVGDLMVAGIFFNNDSSGTAGVATPSGWTLYDSRGYVGGFQGTDNSTLYVFYKVATSGDVAASNFSFGAGSSGSEHTIGHIVRVTDFGIIAGGTKGYGVGGTSYSITGFTPSRSNTLMIAFCANINPSGINPVNSISFATNNPTWTERAETGQNDTAMDSSFAVYTATRPEATATGSITITQNGASTEGTAIVISLSSTTSGSITPTTKVNAYAFAPFAIDIRADAITEEPTYRTGQYTSWTNEEKPTTTWENETL
jgi:hypothetical protein